MIDRIVLPFFWIAALCLIGLNAQANLDEKTKQLQEQYKSKLETLKQADHKSATLRSEIEQLTKTSLSTTENIDKTRLSIQSLDKDLNKHKKHLKIQLKQLQRLAYEAKLHSFESPDSYAESYNRQLRFQRYLETFRSAHLNNIEAIKTLQQQRKMLLKQLETEKHTLKTQRSDLLAQKKSLQQKRDIAFKTSAQIKKQLNKNQALKAYALKESKKKLRKAIVRTETNSNRLPINIKNPSFAQLKRRLPWPAKGAPVKLSYFDNAWLLSQAGPTPVYAIANGQVLSIQWLPNLGNTIIVEHGSNYRGVYAQLDLSYVKVGQRIKAGTQIAASGNNVGHEENGLIFMLLRKTRQLNLKNWLVSDRRS